MVEVKQKTIEELNNKVDIDRLVLIHMSSFSDFFLTFLGRGFLKQLYSGFIDHEGSGIIAAKDESGNITGFLAYSENLSGFYKYLIKKRLIPFAWYAAGAFFRKPKIMFRLLRAFTYSKSAERFEKYIEVSSICVLKEQSGTGTGSLLLTALKEKYQEENLFNYIKLETDANNNTAANNFYIKNGFLLNNSYTTRENRVMNEYHYYFERTSNNEEDALHTEYSKSSK